MVVTNYFYDVGKKPLEDRYELLDNREQYMTPQYMRMFKEQLNDIRLDGKVAFLYAGGIGVHNSEARNYNGEFECTQPLLNAGPVIKDLQAYMMHKYIGALVKNGNEIVYANINGNTCASGLHSVYEAERLLDNTVDHVVIVSEEKTSASTIRIFHEHGIEIKVGEGFACVVLSKNGDGATIRDTKWEYTYNRNPFLVSTEGYEKVYTEADNVKGHQTGTEQNDSSELEVFGEDVIGYKKDIGHTQGASSLIELCMVLDDENISGSTLCAASGLGGFYGSCVVEK